MAERRVTVKVDISAGGNFRTSIAGSKQAVGELQRSVEVLAGTLEKAGRSTSLRGQHLQQFREAKQQVESLSTAIKGLIALQAVSVAQGGSAAAGAAAAAGASVAR